MRKGILRHCNRKVLEFQKNLQSKLYNKKICFTSISFYKEYPVPLCWIKKSDTRGIFPGGILCEFRLVHSVNHLPKREVFFQFSPL